MIFHSTYKRPVLIVGNGVRFANAIVEMNEFLNRTNIPVLTSMNAVDLVSERNHLGFIGIYGNRIANMIVNEADLVLAVGLRLDIRQIGTEFDTFAPNAHLVRVDLDESELQKKVKSNESKILQDAKSFFQSLGDETISDYSEWRSKCYKARDILENQDLELGNLLIKKISNLLPINPIISIDVGQNQVWAAQSIVLKGSHGRMFIAGGYGSMGCALPYAIGASIANDYNIVYCIIGDGGMQMNIQELEMIRRDRLPIKIFVINNHALGKITESQSVLGLNYPQTRDIGGYSVPEFDKIADAYGIKSTKFLHSDNLIECSDWLTDKDPCLINIHLPWDTKLIPKMDWKQKEMLPKISDNSFVNALAVLTSI